jgi:TIR domain
VGRLTPIFAVAEFVMDFKRNTYRVFFSHGGDDTYVVELLKPRVEGSGAHVFLDTGRIDYGDNFRQMILEELVKCDELLVLFTKSSLKRPWVLAEVGATLIRKKRIVAILYGPTPEKLQELGILSLLGQYKLLTINEFDKYLDQLARRVKEHPQ